MHSDFTNSELDPELLSTPYSVHTKWHVITGAPSSGKTTLINLLIDQGFETFPEVSRLYFEEEMAKGRTIEEIRVDRTACTLEIYSLWLRMKAGLVPDRITFLDRGLPDCLAFYRIAGLDPNEILPDCFQHRYASVFILDRLQYEQDGVRAGDDVYAEYFDIWTERDYRALGYNVVRVPVIPPEERLALILGRLSEDGLL